MQKYAQKCYAFLLETIRQDQQSRDCYGRRAVFGYLWTECHKRRKTGSSYAVHRDKNLLTPTSEPVSAYKVMDLIHFTQEDKKYW